MKLLLENNQPVSKDELVAAFRHPLQTRIGDKIVSLGNAFALKAKLMAIYDLGEQTTRDAKGMEAAVKMVVESPIKCDNLCLETRENESYLVVQAMEHPIELKYDGSIIDRFQLVQPNGSFDYQRDGTEVDIRKVITHQTLLLAGITSQSPEQLANSLPDLKKAADSKCVRSDERPRRTAVA
jgi:hypothetical protein